MLPPLLIIFLLSCLLLSLDDAVLLEEPFDVGALGKIEGTDIEKLLKEYGVI